MTIGERIKAERDARGWSQLQLAKRASVSQQLITRLETGKVFETKKVVQIAKVFGISAEELLNGEDPWESGKLGRSMEHARVADEDSVTPERLGQLIREKRIAQKMTQSDLADRIGVTKGAISHWELGRVEGINPVNLHWLAQVLRLSDEDLVLFMNRPKLSFPELPPLPQSEMEVIHMYASLPEPLKRHVRGIIEALSTEMKIR